MSMKTMDKLRDMLCEELDKLARKDDMGAGDLEIVHKLTDTIKNIDKICIMDDDGGYSQAGDWEAVGHIGGTYDRGNSYRGRKRDSMGRYSRRGYSRDGGEDLMEHIEKMMDEAETPRERDIIKRFRMELERV